MSGARLQSYSLSVAQQDVSPSMMPESRPRLANTSSRRIVQVASQSGTISSGSSLLFQLASGLGSGFACSGSFYCKFTINVNQVNAPAWSFKQTGSGNSVFQRVSLIASGQNIESINMYNKLYNSLLLHATNSGYVVSDARVHDDINYGIEGAGHATASYTVSVPILLGALNSSQHLPLFLLSSCLLQFDTESVLQALTSFSADAITNYTISDATVVYEQLVPEPAFEAGIKQMLASRVYQLKLDTWLNNRYAQQNSVTQTIGVNSSSVRSVFWGTQATQTQRNAGHLSDGGQSRCQIYADGALVHNGDLSEVSQKFCEAQRALGLMFDVARTSVAPNASNAQAVAADITIGPCNRTTYLATAYLGGMSLQRETLDNASFSFVGSPVQNLVISWNGNVATGEFFVFLCHQQILTIDAGGNVNLIR